MKWQVVRQRVILYRELGLLESQVREAARQKIQGNAARL